jgi:DNA replication protein DnaC
METLGGILNKQEPRQDTCDIHGDFESRNLWGTIWTRCPPCEDIRLAEQEADEKKKRAEKLYQFFLDSIGTACIPERFTDRTLDTYKATNQGQQHHLGFCKDYAANFKQRSATGQSIIMVGLPGTGKTHLAVGIALHIMREFRATALFYTVQRVVRRVKDTWSRGSEESESQAIKIFTSPDLLILDEVGIQFGSETEKQILFDILNDRYEKRKPTIIISNLSKDEVFNYLGERVADRLREDGGKLLVFDWESYRRQK